MEYGIQTSDADLELPFEDALALQLVEDLLPEMTKEEMQCALLSRHSMTDAFGGDDPWEFIEGQDVEEVCTSTDRKFLKGEQDRLKKVIQERRQTREKIVAAVGHKFSKSGKVSGKSVGKRSKAPSAKLLDRWWASIPGDPSFVEDNLPPGGRVSTDHWCGRFKVSYQGQSNSISWTVRGMQEAGLECLRVLWKWHQERTGEPAPIPLVLEA